MKIQSDFLLLAASKKRQFILAFEYPATITLGKRSVGAGHVLLNPLSDDAKTVDVVESERGGQATLHSPGQLVIYPILNLRDWNLTVRSYVRFLETTTQAFFKMFQIPTTLQEGDSGVYLESGEKVAFIGLKVQRNITCHGIAINISNQLNLFDLIVSCGVKNRPVQSLRSLGFELPLERAFTLWADEFIKQLSTN